MQYELMIIIILDGPSERGGRPRRQFQNHGNTCKFIAASLGWPQNFVTVL